MFHFIVKTPNSKAISNSRDDSEALQKINRHAQVFRSKGLPRRRKPLNPSSAPVGWLQREPGTSAATRSPNLEVSQLPALQHATASASCVHGYSKSKACPECFRLVLCKTPWTATADPFAILPISMNAEKYRIMHYFVMCYLPAQLTFYEIADTARTNIVKGCLADEIHFYSLLAAATARMKHVTKDAFSRPDLPEYFASRAVSLMRQHLLRGKAITQQIILDMFLLATAESYSQNWPGVFMHRTAFKHSVAALGGFSKLDPSICKMLWRGDLFVAAVTYTQPILELCWDPGPLDSQASMCLKLLSSGNSPLMGAGFREDLKNSSNEALLNILEDVIGFAGTMQYFWSDFTEVPWDRDWIWARSSALVHKLLSLEEISTTPASSPTSETQLDWLVEECTRLAVVIWLYFGFFLLGRDPPQRETLRVVVRNSIDFSLIQKRLIRIMKLGNFVSIGVEMDDSQELTLPRYLMLVLWILGLGVLAAVNKEEVLWLSRHFTLISRRVGTNTYEEFEEKVSSRYLWLRLLEEASGRQLTKLYDRGNQE